MVEYASIAERHGHLLVHFLNVEILVEVLLGVLADVYVLERSVDAVEERPYLGLCYLACQCVNAGLYDVD